MSPTPARSPTLPVTGRCAVSHGRDFGRLGVAAVAAGAGEDVCDVGDGIYLIPSSAEEGLDALVRAGFPLACITNKSSRFTAPLLERIGFEVASQVI